MSKNPKQNNYTRKEKENFSCAKPAPHYKGMPLQKIERIHPNYNRSKQDDKSDNYFIEIPVNNDILTCEMNKWDVCINAYYFSNRASGEKEWTFYKNSFVVIDLPEDA